MSDTVNIRPETAQQERLRGLMDRQATRFLQLCRRRRHLGLPLDQSLHDWFCGWQTLIQREYADAINGDDSIIGKQWHFVQYKIDIPNER